MAFRLEEDLRGIKGWLILVAIGLIISPLRLAIAILPTYIQIFTNGSWQALTTPGSESYNLLWIPILAIEIVYNVSMFLALLWLLFLFFSKHPWFPRIYIVLMIAPLFFLPFDSWLVSLVMPELPVFDETTVGELGRTALGCVIWVPYMLQSKRVKATFTDKTAREDVAGEHTEQL